MISVNGEFDQLTLFGLKLGKSQIAVAMETFDILYSPLLTCNSCLELHVKKIVTAVKFAVIIYCCS